MYRKNFSAYALITQWFNNSRLHFGKSNTEADRIDAIGGVNSPQGEVLYREGGIAASPYEFAPKSRGRWEILDK